MLAHEDVLCDVLRNILSCGSMYLIAFLIPCHHADGLDKGMSRVVHPSLDALVQGPVTRSLFVPQLGIDGWGESTSHAVIVLTEIWEISTLGERPHTTHQLIIYQSTLK